MSDDLDETTGLETALRGYPEVTFVWDWKNQDRESNGHGRLTQNIKALLVSEDMRDEVEILGIELNGDELVRKSDAERLSDRTYINGKLWGLNEAKRLVEKHGAEKGVEKIEELFEQLRGEVNE